MKKLLFIAILIIVIVSGFLRFYNNKGLSNFTYDQARDALYIKRIIVDHKFRLIGLQSSIPGLYTPPFYYYFMAPFLFLSKMDPKGLDYTTAFFGVLTVVLLYYTLKEMKVRWGISLLVSLLYGASPEIVFQSRYAWNPNIIPFFTLLSIFSLLKIFNKEKKILYYISLFVSLGMIVNLHYSGLVFLIPFLILIIINWKNINKKKVIFGFLFLLILLLPVFVFDLRHGFTNIKGVIEYFLHNPRNEVSPPPFLFGLTQKYDYLIGLLVPFQKIKLLFSITVFLLLTYLLIRLKDKVMISISFIFFLSIFLSSFYARGFYSFYLTFLFPIPFLLLAKLLSWRKEKITTIITGLLLIIMAIANFRLSFNQISETKQDTRNKLVAVAKLLALNAKEPFNIVSINVGEGRFGNNAVDYRYFLETFYLKKSLDWNPNDYKDANNLYLISEIGEIDPLKTNIWEVEMFNPKKVVKKWKLDNNLNVYHLVQ